MKELKNSPYKNVKAAVLGSRNRLCLHEDVKDLETIEAQIECKLLRNENECEYYANFAANEFDSEKLKEPMLDIEDLCKDGARNKYCPYFMSRDRIKEAEVIFMPYNYLLHPILRDDEGIDLKNAIIIIDQVHDLPEFCIYTTSALISTETISNALGDLDYVI